MWTDAMKSGWLVLGLGMLSEPAWGQPVTLADLNGITLQARFLRDVTGQVEGREISMRAQYDWKVAIEGDQVTATFDPKYTTLRGTRQGKILSGTFTLERPQPAVSMGGGDLLWVFSEQALTFLRTFREGAYKMTYAMSRAPGALACSARQSFPRENSIGPLAFDNLIDGRPVTVVRAKEVSATCQVMPGAPKG
jgi:hypothetical protein